MSRPSPEIRSATPDEMPRVISVIVAAFLTDPPARFAWSAPHDYLCAMPLATREFVGECFRHGTAYVSSDFRGAALWLPPGVQPDGESLGKIFRDTANPQHLEDLLSAFEKMDRSHPTEPHWYLAQIGVDPCSQGQGLGAALMRHALARCDPEKSLAYLETGNPRNIPLYRHFGFEVIGEIRAGLAPAMTPMLRRPH
jgi:ribosomal protein S18 acetylase RimI-like enzyme